MGRDRALRWTEICGLVVLVTAFVALVVLDARNGTLRAHVVPATIAWLIVAFVGFALVMLGQQRRGRGAVPWGALVAIGLALRLALLFTEPTLSDDVYRYLWEGHLVTEGVSPYAFTIEDPAGDAYAIPARAMANNTSLASPYLPVAHGVFGAAALVLPSEAWTMQLIMIAFDGLAMAMIVRLLRFAQLPRERALLYWLNPLVIVEVAHGAHIDAMILGFGLAGVALTMERKGQPLRESWAGPVLLGVATLTRPLAVLFLPVLFWQWRWPHRALYALTVAVPVVIAGVWVGFGFEGEGVGLFGSAQAYTESFRFNSGIYHWFETWVAGRGLDDRGWNEPMALARLIVFGVVGFLLVAVFVRSASIHHQDRRGVLRMLTVPLMIYVLFTPVLHPWYVLLLLALLPILAPGPGEQTGAWTVVAPWLVLSCLLVFSYLTYEDPVAFAEREWVRRLEWFPTLTLVAVGMSWVRRSDRSWWFG